MAQRTVYSNVNTITDTNTGEVITYESKKVIKEKIDSESFYMTFLDYIAPVYSLKSAATLNLLRWLCENAEFNTGKVSITPQDRKDICDLLDISAQQITNGLKKLKDLNLIDGGNGSFRINPQIFWKGDAQSRRDLLKDKELQISFELV